MTVYIVVGEYQGVVCDVELYLDERTAQKRKKEIIKDYGRDKVKSGESTVSVWENDQLTIVQKRLRKPIEAYRKTYPHITVARLLRSLGVEVKSGDVILFGKSVN